MRVLAFPLRIASGSFATVEQWSPAEATMIAGSVVATRLRERPLAPDFGCMDPIGVGVSAAEVSAAIALSEPDLEVIGVVVAPTAESRQPVQVSVRWIEETTNGV
jgi:hypothetical protein